LKSIVVGGGFGGLATAALLARQGHEVTLIEKNSSLGGRARTFSSDEYTFDMGPSWYLMPEVFDHLFNKLGFSREDFYDIIKLDPSFQIVSDGKPLLVRPNIADNKELFESLEPDGYIKFCKYMDKCSVLYEKTMNSLLYREFNGLNSMISPKVFKNALGMNILSSMESFNKKFFKSKELQYISGFSSVFLGGSPSNIPAVYSMINYSIFKQGVFYPVGGFGRVVDAFVSVGKEMGVNYITGEEISEIHISGNKITDISGNHGKYASDLFIFNADYHHIDRELLPEGYRNYSSSYWDRKRLSPSAILAYIGVSIKLNFPHHNIIIDGGWEDHFNSINNKSETIPDNFSFYLSVRSRSDPKVAPAGGENLFVLIPVSPFFNDNPESREIIVNMAIQRLERLNSHSFVERITYKRIYGRSDFMRDYNSYLGSAFGLSQTLRQTAGMRPSMRNRKIQNMFYVGQYTHPGIGVPMTIISAEILASILNFEAKNHVKLSPPSPSLLREKS
jgi:phytoene desaturase